MDEHLLSGDPPIRVRLRRSRSARRYSLRVSRLDGSVTLTMPEHASRGRAVAFIEEKAGWIGKRLSACPSPVAVGLGSVLPVRGVPLTVRIGADNRVLPRVGAIEVSPRTGSVAASVLATLKAAARDDLGAETDRFARALGQKYTRITLRDTRSRWGSCSAEGRLMYSWRLVLAPSDVLTYVAAHEVSHLAEMNHGPAFWATVEQLMPDFRHYRSWLRSHGQELHRYRFAD